MSNQDWYRNERWDETEKINFLKKVQRAKSQYNKAQYLRIQASYIQGYSVSDAIELLQLIFKDFPDESQLASAHFQMAECHLKMGKIDKAIDEFELTFENQREYPKYLTMAHFSYADLILKESKSKYYQRAKDILNEFYNTLLFPKDKYQHFSLSALLSLELGDESEAKHEAKEAIAASKVKTSGFKYHPNVGIVSEGIDQKIYELANT